MAQNMRISAAALILLGVIVASSQAMSDLTRDNGAPVGDNQNSQTAGPNGPVLLQPAQLAGMDYDALDATKIWSHVPETKIGTMTLNRNPENVFLETEQSALAPSNLVPGIEPSEDRLLQGRIFSYADTQLYRVGTDGLQLPVNRPRAAAVNYNQDGARTPVHAKAR